MKRNNMILFLFSAAGMLALILDGRTALQGASEGIDLCMRALIPSLFPFLFLSSLLTTALRGMTPGFLRPLTAALGIPEGTEGILISGFLGGYPAGAQTIGQAYRQGTLDKDTACHLLSFCSNAGPAFLFGVTASQFPEGKTVWVLWGIHILSALLAGLTGRKPLPGRACLPGRELSVSDALNRSVKTTGIICGWVVLFRILLSFLDRWILWAVPETIRVLIWGLLELSNGCCALNRVVSGEVRFVLCSVMLSFGGLCVAMQTASLIGDLPVKAYLKGKLLQTLFALGLSLCYVLDWGIMVLPIPSVCLLSGIVKKRSSIPCEYRV